MSSWSRPQISQATQQWDHVGKQSLSKNILQQQTTTLHVSHLLWKVLRQASCVSPEAFKNAFKSNCIAECSDGNIHIVPFREPHDRRLVLQELVRTGRCTGKWSFKKNMEAFYKTETKLRTIKSEQWMENMNGKMRHLWSVVSVFRLLFFEQHWKQNKCQTHRGVWKIQII